MSETNIFELLLDKYNLPNKPKLFESFSGIGTQRMAFNRLGIDYEMVGISEIDKYAIKSYMEIHGETKNYGSTTEIKGSDLPQIDVFTWSFPCTDLSKAGQQKGLSKETRSGLVYEVLRIINETKEHGNMPKVLIMENVVDLVQVKFIKQFQEIQLELEQLGYTNYVETLNSKNYGVAQNRDRVFMVSILGNYYYEFPKPIPLQKKLKDYLEDEVDEKYYLSDKMLKYINSFDSKSKQNGSGTYDVSSNGLVINRHISKTINTRTGNSRADTSDYICDELDDNFNINGIDLINFIPIPEKTIKGYAKAYEGDGVYLNRPHQKRGVVQNQMIQTLKTSGTDVGVIDNMRIRKLTPLEVWRLMSIDDKDYYKAAQVNSNAQLYKQAGNAIVVDVFAAIIKKLI